MLGRLGSMQHAKGYDEDDEDAEGVKGMLVT